MKHDIQFIIKGLKIKQSKYYTNKINEIIEELNFSKDCESAKVYKNTLYDNETKTKTKDKQEILNIIWKQVCQIAELTVANNALKETLKAIEENIMNIHQDDLSDYTKECLKSALRHIEESEE